MQIERPFSSLYIRAKFCIFTVAKANGIVDLQDKAENKMLWLPISVYSEIVFCQKCMWWLYKKFRK